MSKSLKRLQMWAASAMIAMLVVFSIAGAFLGVDRAKELFNSQPLTVFWLVLTVLLTVGMLSFARLRREPGLLLIHAGSVLVLLGAMWGSEKGHQLQKELFGIDKVPRGYMVINEGQSENRLISKDGKKLLGTLLFHVKLHDFRMDYYWDDGKLLVQSRQRQRRMSATEGAELAGDGDLPGIKILRKFRNFRIKTQDGEKSVSDDSGAGENPALEVELRWPSGKVEKKYIFERFANFGVINDNLRLKYILMVRDYFSDLEVLPEPKDSRPNGTQKVIEVNDPLHYGGYYFYQSDYDHERGRYTVLTVSSDTGRTMVFAGYLLLCVGVFWWLWLRKIIGKSVNR